jgi:hypothetical protein
VWFKIGKIRVSENVVLCLKTTHQNIKLYVRPGGTKVSSSFMPVKAIRHRDSAQVPACLTILIIF